MNYNVSFSCISHIGKRRSINQDNFICDGKYIECEAKRMNYPITGSVSTKSPLIVGVFDGMGGEECGEIASLIAAKHASKLTIGKRAADDVFKYCMDANEEICKYAQENLIGSMGTTAAMLVFHEAEIVLCNIGDSKIFRFSKGAIEQISYDHVVRSAYSTKPPLSQNLGIPPDEMLIEPYLAHGKCKKDDIYLICSDGLTDMVKTDDIKSVVEKMKFEEIAQTLLDKALENGGRDNITIIVCKINGKARWLDKLFIKETKEGKRYVN